MVKSYLGASRTAVRRTVQALTLAAGVLAFAPASEAALLGLGGPAPNAPDIMTSSMAINYNHVTGRFDATLTDWLGNFNPGFAGISDLSYSLSADIDNAGNLMGGQLDIFGSIGDLGLGLPGSPVSLLSGTLKQFGHIMDSGHGVFEFLFEVDSSAPALGFGTKGGIVLQSWDLSGDSFASSFSSGGNNTGDSYGVPEPSTLLLLSLGAAAAAARRRFVSARS